MEIGYVIGALVIIGFAVFVRARMKGKHAKKEFDGVGGGSRPGIDKNEP